MQFTLLDQIIEWSPSERIRAVKNLTLGEEYLQDHFPGFPVLPGVLMLEALSQTGAWLVRLSENYRHSIILPKSTKALKYGSFVSPGQQLILDVRVKQIEEREVTLQAKGTVDEATVVSGRIILERYNLADSDPARAEEDEQIIGEFRRQFKLLYREPGENGQLAGPTASSSSVVESGVSR